MRKTGEFSSQAEQASALLTDIAVANAYLAAIVESSDDAIVGKNLDGIILSWNRGAERIFGFTEQEAIGKSIRIIIPTDRQSEEDYIISQIRAGNRVDHFETIRQKKDGTLIDIAVTISPIKNRDGVVVGASKVARDITDQKRANEKFRQELEKTVSERTQQIEKANKELEGFTYSVSHDLRGPLRAIISSSMILREDFADVLPAEAKHELDRQAVAAKKLADLIDDLLKLSRLGRQDLKKAELDMSALANEMANELRTSHCDQEFEIQEGMKAYGDAQTIRLVVGNLLDNACKFSKGSGKITFSQSGETFCITDQGIGFDQQYEEKLFAPFERLVLDREYPGTGIGLANVKRIIDRHGGKVWAESPGLGRGATFFFSLPARPDSSALA